MDDLTSLDNIQREDVIEQLRLMGHTDVPEEIIDDFLRELREQIRHQVESREGHEEREDWDDDQTQSESEEDEEDESSLLEFQNASNPVQTNHRAARDRQTTSAQIRGGPPSRQSHHQSFSSTEEEEEEENEDSFQSEFTDGAPRRGGAFRPQSGSEGFSGSEADHGVFVYKRVGAGQNFPEEPPRPQSRVSSRISLSNRDESDSGSDDEHFGRWSVDRRAVELDSLKCSSDSASHSSDFSDDRQQRRRSSPIPSGRGSKHASAGESPPISSRMRQSPRPSSKPSPVPSRPAWSPAGAAPPRKPTQSKSTPIVSAPSPRPRSATSNRPPSSLGKENISPPSSSRRVSESKPPVWQGRFYAPDESSGEEEAERKKKAPTPRPKSQMNKPIVPKVPLHHSSMNSPRASECSSSHLSSIVTPRPLSARSAPGVIFTNRATPAGRTKKRADPVNRFLDFQKSWQTDPFLSGKKSERKDLRWAVRCHMMSVSQSAETPRPSKALRPNTYVTPTEKRRDSLRWDVRVNMMS